MSDPIPVFVSYSFRREPAYERMLGMLEEQGLRIVNRSVDASAPLEATGDALARELRARIRSSQVVLVHAAADIHNSPHVASEIQAAGELGRPIIGVYPNGEYGRDVPRVLHESADCFVGWRGPSMANAVLGDHPPDRFVFNIAEDVQRQRVALWAMIATAGMSLLLASASEANVALLRSELERAGVPLPAPTSRVLPVIGGALGGALVGYVISRMTNESGSSRGVALGLGATAGGAVGWLASTRLELRDLGRLMVLTRTVGEVR